jgi:hypothetical protein
MNEVFKRLSLEAGGSHYPTINPNLQQRFGELIVKECIEKLLEWQSEPFPFDESTAVWILKKHFGIKE